MKSNTDALKLLYLSIGGEGDENLTVIPDIINTIAERVAQISQTASENALPDVTEANNGQVLTVVDGAWAAADAPKELPVVTADNNGDVLTVVNGAWAADTPEPPGPPVDPDTGEILDSWEVAVQKIANGTAPYVVGNFKPLDLGTEGIVNMQIVASGANASPLAAGGGNASYDFVAKELLTTKHAMNSNGSNTGGWENSEMRSYLKNTIKPLIPQAVRNAIKEVTKTSYRYDTSNANATTTDDVWIPSYREIFGGTDHESQGPIYSDIYTDATSRIKSVVGGSASDWWLRSAYSHSSSYFRYVTANGGALNDGAYYSYGVALGFSL